MQLAVIVPVLNEAAVIESTLMQIAPLRARGAKVIVVDGGSADATIACASPHADHVLHSQPGRAQQMNFGAGAALNDGADVLLFLHADSRLPDAADRAIEIALKREIPAWGHFNVRIDNNAWIFAIVSQMINWRSRMTGICTGDQAIFVTRAVFEQMGGFAQIPLMEDIEFCKRARKIGRPLVIDTPVITSDRRWQRHGVMRTIMLMWIFRLAYFFGTHPQELARRYRDAR